VDPFAFVKYKWQLDSIPIHCDITFQVHVPLEVKLATSIPFEDGLLGAPYHGQELLVDPAV